MPRKKNITKILVIGSGPIVIGQSAEFDYMLNGPVPLRYNGILDSSVKLV